MVVRLLQEQQLVLPSAALLPHLQHQHCPGRLQLQRQLLFQLIFEVWPMLPLPLHLASKAPISSCCPSQQWEDSAWLHWVWQQQCAAFFGGGGRKTLTSWKVSLRKPAWAAAAEGKLQNQVLCRRRQRACGKHMPKLLASIKVKCQLSCCLCWIAGGLHMLHAGVLAIAMPISAALFSMHAAVSGG